MKNSQVFINEIKEKIKSKESQKESTLESLAILDAQIDKYDELIQKIDADALTYVSPITDATNNLYDSYVERITSGCRNNLYWENTECWEVIINESPVTYCLYEVKLNPSLLQDLNFTGIKYYQKPSNRDYNTNIVDTFIGDISDESTVIVVRDPDGIPPEIKVGDTIVDNIDQSPTLFTIGDLPKVVGFGTTTAVVGVSSNIIGGIGTGSTIFAHYGSGDSTNFQIGYSLERAGIVTASIVGFGTTNFTLEYYDEGQAQFVIGIVTCRAIILDSPATTYTADKTFKVGVVSSFPSVNLSTESISYGSTVTFTAIRYSNETIYEDFDYTSNPNSPLKIGIIKSSNIGIGHSVSMNDSGKPVGPDTWKPEKSYLDPVENVIRRPEPEIGAGKVTYSIGDFNWPTITTAPVGLIPGATSYASLGQTIIIPNETGDSFGYTSVSPSSPSPGTCTRIDNDITSNTSIRNTTISTNQPIIQNLIESTRALRNQRAEKELYAWSLVQSAASLAQEIKQLKKDLRALEDTDFSSYES